MENGIDDVPLIKFTNNFQRIVRVIGYVFRFVRNCRNKIRTKPLRRVTRRSKKHVQLGPEPVVLSEDEKREALQYLIRTEQMMAFPKEYNYLKERADSGKCKIVHKDSKIVKLCPYLDKDGILRSGSRLSKADIPYDTKFPAIIESNSPLSYLIA